MTQAARVVEDKSTNYWDIRIGDVFVALAHNQATAQKHADQINAALAPIIQQERRKALEEAAGIAESEPKLHPPHQNHFIGGLVNFQWASDRIAKSIRALRGEG